MSLFEKEAVKWTPHKYQIKAMKFLVERPNGALFLDPGLGKTAISLGAFKILKKKGIATKALVIAPLRVCHQVWEPEIKKWKDFENITVKILHGNKKEDLLDEETDVTVINPEGLEWLFSAQKTRLPSGKTRVGIDLRRIQKLGFDTLIIDELTKFKNTNTIRFKMFKQALPLFKRRWGLTGSPTANSLEDLFGQCYVLDLGKTFGQYITHFRNNFFLPSPDGFGWVLKQGAEERIYERVRPLAIRLAAEDYLDMPNLISNEIYVDLPDKVRKIYDDMEEELIALIDKKIVTAANVGTAIMKCRQIANGGLYLEAAKSLQPKKGPRAWKDLHYAKVDALADLVEELQGAPLLVAYDFGHDLSRIRERLGDVPFIGGGISVKDSKDIENRWNRGKIPVLLGHPASIALGLNLQESSFHICWHSMTWSLDLYDQTIRRIWRQGNKARRVFVHHILAKDTIDEVIIGALQNKARRQNELFKALKASRINK